VRVRPTKIAFGLVGGAVILFGVGTNVQAGWVLVLAAMLLGICAAGAVLPFVALRGVVVEREAPATARAGEAVPVSVTVRNASRGLRGLVGVRDSFCGEGWAVVDVLRPGQARRFTDRRTGARRGVYTGGPVGLATGAPFGVAVAWKDIEVATTTVVHPRVFPARVPDALGRTAVAVRTPSGDISGVREYRSGDQLRHVHWRSTARRGELVVREFTEEDRGDLTIVVDAPHDPDTADAVASVACSIARAALGRGREVELRSGAGTVSATSPAVADDWGARLQPGGPGVEELLARGVRDALVVVIAAEERNAAAVSRLTAMSPSVVVLVDPDGREGARRVAASFGATLSASGHDVQVIPVAEDLSPWLR